MLVAAIGQRRHTARSDRVLGDLTYATYLLHLPLLIIIQRLGWPAPAAFALAGTYLGAVALLVAFELPLDRLRDRLYQQAKQRSGSLPPVAGRAVAGCDYCGTVDCSGVQRVEQPAQRRRACRACRTVVPGELALHIEHRRIQGRWRSVVAPRASKRAARRGRCDPRTRRGRRMGGSFGGGWLVRRWHHSREWALPLRAHDVRAHRDRPSRLERRVPAASFRYRHHRSPGSSSGGLAVGDGRRKRSSVPPRVCALARWSHRCRGFSRYFLDSSLSLANPGYEGVLAPGRRVECAVQGLTERHSSDVRNSRKGESQ